MEGGGGGENTYSFASVRTSMCMCFFGKCS